MFLWRQAFEGVDGIAAFKVVMINPHGFFFSGLAFFNNKVQLFLQTQYCQCFVTGLRTLFAGSGFCAGGQMNDSYRGICGIDVLTAVPGGSAGFYFNVTCFETAALFGFKFKKRYLDKPIL